MKMSLLIPSSAAVLTDASDISEHDACDVSHINQTQTQNQKNDGLNSDYKNDQSYSTINTQNLLIETEKNLQIILKINGATFDKLVNQLQLSLLKQLKQSLEKLKIDNDQDEYHEHKTNTNNLIVNGSIAGDGDNLTVVSRTTGITGVSSIASPLSMNDPLIVILGIGEYDGMPNLESVIADYDNIVDTFLKYWKYFVFYKLNNNKYIYTNNISDINNDNNYAIKWNGDDIDDFIEESRKHVVLNKHDGLMFFISSHGDRDKVLYDSECEIYELDGIFSMYSQQASSLLESYNETQQQSNHLLSIPKIFFLDMCRGDQKAKVTQIETAEKNKITTKEEAKVVAVTKVANEEGANTQKQEKGMEIKKQDQVAQESGSQTPKVTKKKKLQNKAQAGQTTIAKNKNTTVSLHNKNKEKKAQKETFVLKGINKEDCHKLVGQMANFSKIYANTEGFSVMGGSEQGGIFMRSVCRVFKDSKYVVNHKFTDIILKIREYTKRDSTLKTNLFNFTQIVENEGTFERQVVFASKYISSLFSHSLTLLNNNDDYLGTLGEENDHFTHDEDDDLQEKLCITNLSSWIKIGVLVEMEQNRENRTKMFEILKKSNTKDDNYGSFIENGFAIIDEKYGSYEFVKVWNEYYVTMFVLSDAYNDGKNTLIHDRKLYFDNYLYFKGNKLHTLHEKDILPKCNKVGNESHTLNVNNSTSSSNTECGLCSKMINNNSDSDDDIYFECKSCQEFICKDCCVSLIVNKIPQEMKESKYFELTIVNTSTTNKIAVLVNIYGSLYNTERYNMIKLEKYKEIKDDQEFIENGFLIINSNGDTHTFKTVWQCACITIIETGSNRNKLVFDGQMLFGKYPLYYIAANKLISMENFVPEIVALEQKTKKSVEITLKKPLHADTMDLEYKIQSEITNGRQILKSEYPIEMPQQVEQGKIYCSEIKLNIDELEKEFKETQLNYSVKSLVAIGPKNKIQCSFDHAMKGIPIFIQIQFDYSCTFTTLNGTGRYGPTNMDKYKGQCHYNDTILEEGMQLWTIPKSGKYKVICYGAKGGDSIYEYKNKRLSGGFGAKVGSIFKLFEDDTIKIVCGQKGHDSNGGRRGGGGGGGGGSYFILYKIGNKNPNYNENQIVNIPLIIAAGGNGACNALDYRVNGIDGLCATSENRNYYGGYKTNGKAGRGASFQNDFDIFQSYKASDAYDYNECNPKSFVDGAIGGKRYEGKYGSFGSNGGFGGGGGSCNEGGGGGGYIGGLVSREDKHNKDFNKYYSYGALSYVCQHESIVENINKTQNNGNGKIEIMFTN